MPIAAAIGSSIRNTRRAPARSAEWITACFSTCVMPDGIAMTTRGFANMRRAPCTRWMKYRSIASQISKSAMTPSFMGRMTPMLPGVLPSISFARRPTAWPSSSTWLVPLRTATTEGSEMMTPRPGTQTSVFAVPRSIPMSTENIPVRRSRNPIIP